MDDVGSEKAVARTYLQRSRDALVWKLDGLSEREVRLPRTSTGVSLLGIIKHCVNVEAGYFGPTFGREWPTPEELVPESSYETDPQADWYATEDESKDDLLDLYRRVWVFADEAIGSLPMDAPGKVPWWPEGRADCTLREILTHVTVDLARHGGHADVVREMIDGDVGMTPVFSNVPDTDWTAYRDRLTRIAERFEA